MTEPAAAADAPRLYKPLRTPWAIPQAVADQAARVVAWMADELRGHYDLDGVQIRWFEDAGPTDRADDPGCFLSPKAAWGAVRPAEPKVLRLHRDNVRRSRRGFSRTVAHESIHCGQFGRGMHLTHTLPQLEAMVAELLATAFAPELSTVSDEPMA